MIILGGIIACEFASCFFIKSGVVRRLRKLFLTNFVFNYLLKANYKWGLNFVYQS